MPCCRPTSRHDGQEFGRAFSRLENVVRSIPIGKTPRRRLVNVAMIMHRFSDAKEHLERYLLKKSPHNPELLRLYGQCQAELADYTAAVETLKKAVSFGPDQVEAYSLLAFVSRYLPLAAERRR